jgi:hypothetical protein
MNIAWDRILKSDSAADTQIQKPLKNYKPRGKRMMMIIMILNVRLSVM